MWDKQQLNEIIAADDLHVAPYHRDGQSTGTPTWIWCVAVAGELYVRAYSGSNSRWYQAALAQQAGQIHAAGKVFEVTFEPVTGPQLDAIDQAYQAKYTTSRYLAPMISERARGATVKVLPKA